MVLLHLKKSEESLFLFETTLTTPVQQVVEQVVQVQNMRLKIGRLISAAQDLIEYGEWKPESEHGYTEDHLESLAVEKDTDASAAVKAVGKDSRGRPCLLNPDPTGRRCGQAPMDDMAQVILKTLDHAHTCISTELVKSNKTTTMESLNEAFNNIRGATMIVFPQGLPEWEPVQEIFDGCESDLERSAASKDIFEVNDTNLWWANKCLNGNGAAGAGKLLSDFLGKNEKSKVIVKMQKKSFGAPVRESPMNEQAQKEMMAYYYKKQEENKKLLENDEDDYLNSSWANTKALKAQFNGLSQLKWGPR